MKKLLLTGLFALAMGQASAQCNELFISEYVEGSRNNKAIEIYNPTNTEIDLSQYRFTRWQNGSAAWTTQYSDLLSGTIGPNQVRVLVLDRRDTTKVGQDTAVTLSLRLKADLWLSADYNTSFSMSFNGDDALSLDKKVNNQYVPVDIFGKIGQQPKLASNPSRTIGWSDSSPYYTGLGLWWTIDHTMIRKRSIKAGVSTNPASFNPKAEWDLYPENTFDSLRTHNCDCQQFPASVRSSNTYKAVAMPNPAMDEVAVIAPFEIAECEFYSAAGLLVNVPTTLLAANGTQMAVINLKNIPAGIYLALVKGANGENAQIRILHN